MMKRKRESSPMEQWPTWPNHSTSKNCFLRLTGLSSLIQNETIEKMAGDYGWYLWSCLRRGRRRVGSGSVSRFGCVRRTDAKNCSIEPGIPRYDAPRGSEL